MWEMRFLLFLFDVGIVAIGPTGFTVNGLIIRGSVRAFLPQIFFGSECLLLVRNLLHLLTHYLFYGTSAHALVCEDRSSCSHIFPQYGMLTARKTYVRTLSRCRSFYCRDLTLSS